MWERSWRQALQGRVGQLLFLDHEDKMVLFYSSGHASTQQSKATTARMNTELCAAEMNDALASVRTRGQSISCVAIFGDGTTRMGYTEGTPGFEPGTC